MRKTGIVCFLIVGILLSGCSRKSPEAAPDDGCLTLGTSLEVAPMEGWVLLRNEDVLAAEGMYYAQWTSGEEATYKSEDGTQITAHGGEIHLVIVESEDPDVLQTNARQWIALTQERYPRRKAKKANSRASPTRWIPTKPVTPVVPPPPAFGRVWPSGWMLRYYPAFSRSLETFWKRF